MEVCIAHSTVRQPLTIVCRQLQALFAHLQHSELACYDPAALTSALSLNTSVQQDAQEVRLRAAPPLKPHFAQPIPLLANWDLSALCYEDAE